MKKTNLTLLTLLLAACASGSNETPAPVEFDDTYVPPANRIDPVAAAAFESPDFAALGAARAGVSGVGRAPEASLRRYVSAANGDDANDGSEANPWRTLQHAADTAEPGTMILVDDSAPYAGGLQIHNSGEPGRYIVFANRDPGRAPIIQPDPSRRAVVEIDASYVVLRGFDIGHHQRATLDDDTIGVLVEPNDGDISNVYVVANRVHHIGPPDLSDVSCYYNGHGIIAQAEGHRISAIVIDGNEIHDMYVGNSEVLVLNGNVNGFRVTNNYVHDVNNIAIDIIGYEKNSSETTSNGLVADNVVLDASNYWPYCSRGNCTYPAGDESSDGIYVDGGASMVIEYNVVGRTDHGIELQSENGELIRDVEVRYNVVFNSNYKNITIGDSENVSEHDNVTMDEARLADASLESCKR